MAIILDLETVAIDNVADLVEPVSAPANYKDPEKIAAYIADAQKTQADKAALFAWTARIVALGWIDAQGEHCELVRDEAEERAALGRLARAVWRDDDRFVQPVIGFNHRVFDLPVILARSLLLGVKFPPLNLDRYRTPHTDLLEKLTWYGAIPARSLKWYARRFGIPVDDAVNGADIAALVAAGDWPAIEAHNRSDLRLTQALAERLGVVRGSQVSVGAA